METRSEVKLPENFSDLSRVLDQEYVEKNIGLLIRDHNLLSALLHRVLDPCGLDNFLLSYSKEIPFSVRDLIETFFGLYRIHLEQSDKNFERVEELTKQSEEMSKQAREMIQYTRQILEYNRYLRAELERTCSAKAK